MWRNRATSQPAERREGFGRVTIRNRRPMWLSIASGLILTAVVLAVTALALIRESGPASAASTPSTSSTSGTPTTSACGTPAPTKTPTPTPTATSTCTPTSSSPTPTASHASPSPTPSTTTSTAGSGGGSGGSGTTGGSGGGSGGTTGKTGGSGGTGRTPGGRTHTGSTATGYSGPVGGGQAGADIRSATAVGGGPGSEVLSTSVPNLGALPEISAGGLTARPGSAASMFPTIGAEPDPAPQQAVPGHGPQAAADNALLDRQLLGTQMLGLAALCAAVGIVIARLTLRGRPPASRTAPTSTA